MKRVISILKVLYGICLLSGTGLAWFDGNNSSNFESSFRSDHAGVTHSAGQRIVPDGMSRKSGRADRYREWDLIVKFKNDVKDREKHALHQRHGSTKLKEFKELRLQHVKLKQGLNVNDVIKQYHADPNVEYAEPNYTYTVQGYVFPNDSMFNELWGLQNTGQNGGPPGADIDAPGAWYTTTGSSNVVVAVIDTGADYTHPDLIANIWTNPAEVAGNGLDDDNSGYIDDLHGINTITGSGNPIDDHGHGTHVAGTIGAVGNNGLGVVGVNWNVKILACKFLGANGSGDTAGAVTCLH